MYSSAVPGIAFGVIVAGKSDGLEGTTSGGKFVYIRFDGAGLTAPPLVRPKALRRA